MDETEVLEISLYDEPIGTITHLPGDRNFFVFNQNYVENPNRSKLSLSFQDVEGELIAEPQHTRTRLPSFFSNMLPEGHMREYLASQARVEPQREFYLLAALGKDLPGAVSVKRASQFHWDKDHLDQRSGLMTEPHILRFSLAGLQLKFSAIWETHGGMTIPLDGIGGSWIVKLPSAVYSEVPENEFAMMEMARRVGIDVPETSLISINQIQGIPRGVESISNNAFVIKRFDRGINGNRIHIEDFAQVFGVFPEKKYRAASYRNIAEVIFSETGEKGILEFVRRFVFNALIGNGDMHLKNWSFIYNDKTNVALAPAYDFVSTIPYLPNDQLALTFVDSKAFSSLSYEQFKRFASKAKLSEHLVLEAVYETTRSFASVWKTSSDLNLNDSVFRAITEHLNTIPIWKDLNFLL